MTNEPTRRWLLSNGSALLALCSLGCSRQINEPTDSQATTDTDVDTGVDTDEVFDPCSVEVGSAAEGWTALALSAHIELEEVGGWSVVSLEGRSILVAQVEADCFIALSAICTHEGCTVEFRTSRVVCPCHGATFHKDGRVMGGPTNIPLESYPAARSGDEIWVQLNA